MKKILLFLTLSFAVTSIIWANDYIAIAKNGNVYDEANAKYITVNQENEDVAVIPGMVFSTTQHTPGWYKIEYSPGLHAFVPDQIAATTFKAVEPGIYEIVNYSGHKLNAQKDGENWSASVDGKTYKGSQFQEIIIFSENGNQPAFSIVDIGNGPIAIAYDNAITKFF